MGAAESTLDNEIEKVSEIRFHLHDTEHVAKCEDMTPNTTLNHYLRNFLNMTGTKGMCFEGGCGACVVVLQNKDPITQKDVFLAVNSCLVPLLSCNDWRIYTIEGIGNAVEGYHPIQQILAKFNGTQCGFCSPGMVMNMYALYESGKLKMEEVENAFSGNICRCTGYRPILAAFKSLCTDATPGVLGECPDIEDMISCYKEKCEKRCKEECPKKAKGAFYLEFGKKGSKWVKVHTLRDLIGTINANPHSSYRLVAGNTAQGVFPSYNSEVDLYIDISDVAELKVHTADKTHCVLGASTTLTDTIEFFNEVAETFPKFAYLKAMADHIDLVANRPVRNRATIAGNLIIKHDHHDFPSDIFLILETVSATLTAVNLSSQEINLTPTEFINFDMARHPIILKTVTLKPYPPSVKYVSYKIMPRAQNVHAIVNAGFLFTFNQNNLLQNARMVFGNINPEFVHAKATENFLTGKNLFDNSVLGQAYTSLRQELRPDVIPPDASPPARKKLAIGLFYKAVLSIAPDGNISSRNKSGGDILKRPLSNGVQDYETNKSMYPVTQAVTKVEAIAQTSGEAEYVIDLDSPGQLYGALVLAKAPPNSTIRRIDTSDALKREGIVCFYSKDDIPGKNSFTPMTFLTSSEEEIFCSGRVKYYEQPIGILIGSTQKIVEDSVDLISVRYDSSNVEPVLSSRQAINEKRTDLITEFTTIQPKRKGTDVKKVIKGTFDIYHQYHFHMETQCCKVVPTENGLDVYASTQWPDFNQIAISEMLNIPQSKVNIVVRRCGGAFGAKITRAGMIACAASLAAWKLKQSVKLWLPLKTNMAAIGKRIPLTTDYEVGVDDKGVIQYLKCSHYTDVGYQVVENVLPFLQECFMNMYTSDTFEVHLNLVVTDKHVNTWTRAPGSMEGVGCIESILEHIAFATGLDPLDVRVANLSPLTPTAKYVEDVKTWANIATRKAEIENFNKANRWKKKGLAVAPMLFNIPVFGPLTVTVSIFHNDGSVQISHGGIEIGQGINTKAIQVCAYKLGIEMDKITVLPSNSFTSPNNFATGGSLTTDGICFGTIQACDELLNRLKPFQLPGAKWNEVIRKAHEAFVNLKATGVYSPTQGPKPYTVYGICATEVLVDILTGQHIINRVDLIEDTGDALNPAVDIGQVEGAFVMGIGYYTTEKIVFNYEGKILTNNTWTYHPPGAKDIPVDFNVKFPKNNPNPLGILRSKGTGEPAISLGITVPLAIRRALASARTDAKESNEEWYKIDGPTDVEDVLLNSLSDYSQFVL